VALHPEFPVVEGHVRITGDWALDLPGRFNRRFEEDGDLVFWRPGLSIWIAVWGEVPGETMEETLAWVMDEANPARTDERIERAEGHIVWTYRLRERDPERDPAEYTSIYGHVFGAPGHVQIATFCDTPEDIEAGDGVIRSLRFATN
jgi:hypothetical protein